MVWSLNAQPYSPIAPSSPKGSLNEESEELSDLTVESKGHQLKKGLDLWQRQPTSSVTHFFLFLLELKPLLPYFSHHPARDFISQPPLQLEVTMRWLSSRQWNVSETGVCSFWVSSFKRNGLFSFSLTAGMDKTMVSFNHMKRANLEVIIAQQDGRGLGL